MLDSIDGTGGIPGPGGTPGPSDKPSTDGTVPAGHSQQGSVRLVTRDDTIDFRTGLEGVSAPVLALPKRMDADVMVLLLYAVQQKQGEAQVRTAEERIQDSQEARQKKHEEIMDKLEEIRKAQEKSKTSAKVGMAFAWVGVALAWIAVGIVAVVSGGLAAAPLVIAATAMTALMICQQTGATDKAVEAMNLNDKEAMGFQIGLAALVLVISIVAAIASFGAGSAGVASSASNLAGAGAQAGTAATQSASTGAAAGAAATQAATQSASTGAAAGSTASQTAGTATQTGAQGAGTATSATQQASTAAHSAENGARVIRVANRIRAAAQITAGVSSVGGGSASISNASFAHDAAIARAETQQERAEMVRLQEITHEQLRRIRKLIQEMQNAGTIVIGVIADCRDTAMNIRRTI